MSVDLGIDLGTASVLVYVKGKGVILKEPSVVAYGQRYECNQGDRRRSKTDAWKNSGKYCGSQTFETGRDIRLYSNRKNDQIFRAENTWKAYIQEAENQYLCTKRGTEVERKAVEEATYAAGAREVHLIEEPVAAAIGAGIDISKPCGNMIVDIGGGTSDIAVISLGGTVVNTSLKIAGDDFDEAIVRYMRKKHNLLIGERTAEDIKIKIGTTYPMIEDETLEVRGRNLVTGLPKTVTVTSTETEEALRETTGQIVEAVISVLERTPPELSADILDRGIMLTGGGSMLRGMEELIEEKTGINTMTADDPMKVVAIGTGEYVEFMGDRKGI